MNEITRPLIRINKITIKNYKAIDELEIEFPKPLMADDPDVFVLGSRNGVGKTSVLECCGLCYLLLAFKSHMFNIFFQIDFLDTLIAVNKKESFLLVNAELEKKEVELSFKIFENTGIGAVKGRIENEQFNFDLQFPSGMEMMTTNIQNWYKYQGKLTTPQFLYQLFSGINHNHLILPFLNYFHSYRKTSEGKTTIDAINQNVSHLTETIPLSTFKTEVIKLLMSKVGLFEGIKEKDAEATLDKLNSLIKNYAHGEIRKLKSLPNGAVDLLISQGEDESSYPFDNLSSGQKEIITTLFLIWKNTRETPGLVLIDEPELHLNVEWHRKFVSSLTEIAPWNQYILATHSEDVFDSVDEDHRIIIKK